MDERIVHIKWKRLPITASSTEKEGVGLGAVLAVLEGAVPHCVTSQGVDTVVSETCNGIVIIEQL